jgi:hypothetical protein
VEKIHRRYKNLGKMEADGSGRLQWELDPAVAAEAQIFRITRKK